MAVFNAFLAARDVDLPPENVEVAAEVGLLAVGDNDLGILGHIAE